MDGQPLWVVDTTLREGEQAPGVSFPAHIRLKLARDLERLGVDVVEAGHPAVSPRIGQSVTQIARVLGRARTGVHCRSRREDIRDALQTGATFMGIFYCVGEARLTWKRTDLHQAVTELSSHIAAVRASHPELIIRYTPEDTVRSPWASVLLAAREALAAGADVISVADTTGWMVPGLEGRDMETYMRRLRDTLLPDFPGARFGVHCHNDRGLALANALGGIAGGASVVDASVMGLGERAGIPDLASLLVVLDRDLGWQGRFAVRGLMELYHWVSRYSNRPIPGHAPVCGRHAFAHCAGIHTQAALENPLHYESLDPEWLGRKRDIVLGHMAGMSALRHALDDAGCAIEESGLLRDILARVKALGETGRSVGQAELRLLVDFCLEERGLRPQSEVS
mgnify:CR=1 FL=1